MLTSRVAMFFLLLVLAACKTSEPAPAATTAPGGITAVPASEVAREATVIVTAAPAGVTLAQYEQLADGMTYEAAVAILGEPSQELSRTSVGGVETVMYEWKGAAPVSSANAMFQDGKLITRAQFGLK